ncbi:sensor histidine kinase [Nonomuraea sp. SBT364]|uniref:sensor histidine kinase n=1 Tax=Nonomuraea sp. SBT364 TaxID=1580530 RepID=UPI00066EBD2A|nr:histidine kinase [Nonomuraea sp. SBT364]
MRFEQGRRPGAADVTLAAVVAAVLLIVVFAAPGTRPLDYVAVLVGSLALVAWRWAPVPSLLVAASAMLLYATQALPTPPTAFPVLICSFAAIRTGHRLVAIAVSVVFLIGSLAAGLATDATRTSQEIVQDTFLLVGWFVAAGVAATVSKHRQAYLEQAEQRAAQAERTREEAARRRAGEERLRIARELHDSLTHSISVIKVQAGVAIHLARKRGDEVPAALLAIQEAGGDAIRELRATLEVLRDSADEPAGSGLDLLGDLVDRARSTGLAATVTLTGERRELPPDVDRAAYRIVQEALTNVTRHAGRASALVRVDYRPDALVVQVDDDGRADPGRPPVPGTGLLGMRERVTALGGSLRAAPRAEGGFTVRAELPFAGALERAS